MASVAWVGEPFTLPIFNPDDATAFIDTVELFVRNFAGNDRRRLRPSHLRRLRRIQRFQVRACRDRKDARRKWGYRITVHQRTRECLHELNRMQQRSEGKLCRVDVAIDFSVAAASKRAVMDWLVRHAVLKYRRPQLMHDEDETVSFVRQASRRRRSARDLIVYSDRHSKITGEIDIVHLELRLLTTHATRTIECHRVKDILAINQRGLIKRCVQLVEMDAAIGDRRQSVNS